MMMKGTHLRPKRRSRSQPLVEVLEDRQLMTASLQPITSFTVPAQQGYTQQLLSADTSTTAHPQTYTITSSNPDIAVSIAQGPFWSLGVNYPGTTASGTTPASSPFTGTLTFQLFQNLTPNTVGQISNLTTTGDFVNTYKYFSRVATGFPDATSYVVQGGSPTLNGAEPSPPASFANENLQQLAFTGQYQLAMANSGINTNTNQFFITTGSPNAALGYGYTIFGQMVAGLNTLTQMTLVPVMANSNLSGEVSQPDAPLTITSATLTNTNPNGVAIIDTTQAKSGETAKITVTATDSVDHTTTSETFTVTVGAYAGPTTSNSSNHFALGNVNFKPFASAVSTAVSGNTATSVQLAGTSGYPQTTTPSTLSYSLVSQPAHGTVTNFNSTTGTLTYTPNKNYVGSDSFHYVVNATGPGSVPAVAMSNPATVTLTIGAVNTGAVRVVGTSPDEVLIVTPVPRRDRGTNTIDVVQVPSSSANGGSLIQVVVNGATDLVQPGTGDLLGIIVYGGNKAKNRIIIDPSVTVPAEIDGGHGYKNKLYGGSVETLEHGWFGHSVLIGGSGPNVLIGLAGHVKFKPSKATILAFAGVPHRRTSDLHPVPPGGTFYRYVKGHLVVVLHNP